MKTSSGPHLVTPGEVGLTQRTRYIHTHESLSLPAGPEVELGKTLIPPLFPDSQTPQDRLRLGNGILTLHPTSFVSIRWVSTNESYNESILSGPLPILRDLRRRSGHCSIEIRSLSLLFLGDRETTLDGPHSRTSTKGREPQFLTPRPGPSLLDLKMVLKTSKST